MIDEQPRQIEHARHPGDDCDDVQGFEPEIHGYAPAHSLEHALDIRNRSFRQNAMTEIKNQWALAKLLHDIVHLAVERCAARQQGQRIDIALHRHARLQSVASNRALESPINTYRADSGHLHVRECHCTCAAWKTDNPGVRDLPAHTRDNFLRRSDTPPLELLGSQHTRPSIEDLYNLDASLELTNQILNRRFHQSVDQLFEELWIAIRK